jgi:RNA polymerase II subunit A-like phosphatase
MSSPTSLHIPPILPFPIKIASLDIQPPSQVSRGTRLLTYSFVYLPSSRDSTPETRFGTWDCSVEGTIQTWKVKVGDVVSEKRAREKAALEVLEPCTHGVQIGGLCGLCGKDMTE